MTIGLKSMTERKAGTRQQIINLAKNYVQSYGYNAFSFQHIADALRVRKASIHHYFRSKEDMGLAMLEDYISLFAKWTVSVESDAPKKKIQSYFKIFERFVLDKSKICPNSVLSSDYKTLPSKMQDRLLELHMIQREWLSSVLTQGQKVDEFSDSFKSVEMADVMISSIQGSLQLARIRKDPDIFKKVSSHLLRQILA